MYRQILSVVPDQLEALHFLGVLLHQVGRCEEAVKLIRAALEIDPGYVAAHNNLGNVYKEQRELAAAEASYRRAIELQPDFVDAHNNLAAVLSDQDRYDEAVAECRRTIELSPEMAELTAGAGSLAERGLHADAADEYLRAMAVKRFHAGAIESMAFSLLQLGRQEAAAALYRRWLQVEPDNPRPRHHLAACTGRDVPARASDAYIRTVFDRFSKTFDKRLGELKYGVPALVVEAVAAELGPGQLGPGQSQLDVLDAGCGTGLCSAGIRPFARRLVGVDLSPGMLEKARSRGGYDELYEAELTEFMDRAPEAYDLIISADALIYFGDLRKVVAAAARSLRPAGCLVVTLELVEPADAADGFRINSHGRYSHTADHIRQALAGAELDPRSLTEIFLRMEHRQQVRGWLAVARRTSSTDGARSGANDTALGASQLQKDGNAE